MDYNIWICIQDINSWVVTLNFPCPARTVFDHLLQYRHALPMVHTFLMILKNIWAHPSLQICVMKRILSPSLQTVLPHSDSRLISMLMKPKSCLRPRQSKINSGIHFTYLGFRKIFIRIYSTYQETINLTAISIPENFCAVCSFSSITAIFFSMYSQIFLTDA